jgi:GNAT superfamily N-acetyltransferase
VSRRSLASNAIDFHSIPTPTRRQRNLAIHGAWCSIEPRELIGSLARSRILAPVDDEPVWSIVCLFIAKSYRGRGLSTRMIEAAVRHAKGRGASVVEAYPVEPKKTPMPAVFAYPGLASAYRGAGFREVARRSKTRPIMRR